MAAEPRRGRPTPWTKARSRPSKLLIGLLLVGWGPCNLAEGVIDHEIFGLHHVNERVPHARWGGWNLTFLLWGTVMLVGGWRLARSGERAAGRAIPATAGALVRRGAAGGHELRPGADRFPAHDGHGPSD